MNKRIRKKVERRTGKPAQPHTTGQKPARQSRAWTSGQGGATYEVHAEGAKQKPKKRWLARRLVHGARKRAEGAVAGVQERAAGAVESVKQRLASTEQRAEALLEKVPGVGAVAARKLHDLTQR